MLIILCINELFVVSSEFETNPTLYFDAIRVELVPFRLDINIMFSKFQEIGDVT